MSTENNRSETYHSLVQEQLAPIDHLSHCLSLSEQLENPPEVELVIFSQTTDKYPDLSAREIAVTAAIQCYAQGGAIMKPRLSEKDQAIMDGTRRSGHLTTRQHTGYTFRFGKVSRMAIEAVLHQYPFYNTEQQSQRYVEIVLGSYHLPTDLNPEQKALFVQFANGLNQAYFELLPLIQESVPKIAKYKSQKIAQEVARYVLPIAQHSRMFHSLSHLQVLRLFHASKLDHFCDETRFIIAKMVKEILEVDPSFILELDKPAKPLDVYSTNFLETAVETEPSTEEASSVIQYPNEHARILLAEAARNVIGTPYRDLPTDEILNLLLDPASNHLLADLYDVGMHDPFTSALRQVSLTFKTRLSHTADSQRQRHRRTPGATPPPDIFYRGHPDYITPMLIRNNPKLQDKYDSIMQLAYKNVNTAINAGIPTQYALSLLPSAHAITVTESGDLFDWAHRLRQRLCYLAQEEIFFISVAQAQATVDLIPEIENLLLAPCGLRKSTGETPFCPEGARFCKQPVYHMKLNEYSEHRLV